MYILNYDGGKYSRKIKLRVVSGNTFKAFPISLDRNGKYPKNF